MEENNPTIPADGNGNEETGFSREDSKRSENTTPFAKDKRKRSRVIQKVTGANTSGDRRRYEGDQRNPKEDNYGNRRNDEGERGPDSDRYPQKPRSNNYDRRYDRDKQNSDREGNFRPQGERPRYNSEDRYNRQDDRPGGEKRKYNNDGNRRYDPDRKSYNKDYNKDGNRNGNDRQGDGERRSYNPNFTRDNRKRTDGRPYDPDRRRNSDHREDRGNRRYDRSDRPSGSKYGERNGDRSRGGFQKRQGGNYRGRDGEYPKFPAPMFDKEIRLNRYIATSGLCSRREADNYIATGQVTVNGIVVTELGSKVTSADIVTVGGKVVRSEKKVYLVMNKPKGYVTTLDDSHADKTVMEIIKDACTERVYPVGRLDKNSLGVLLFTNDGDLTTKFTHPAYSKKKIYQVTLDKALTKADMESIAGGITLEDGVIHADYVSYVGESRKDVGIEIHSGRNRIVRRIFEHLGYKVQKLDRVYFAGLTKKNLKRGGWRFLSPREVQMLKSGQYE